jgi:hypothetical protein
VTFEDLLDDSAVSGISIGCCVDGTAWKDTRDYTVHAHAHLGPGRYFGRICVRSWADLFRGQTKHVSDVVLEELAHLRAQAGHTEPWRREMRKLGAPIPAHHRRRKSSPKLA